jgi:three-Cys-motif partner protein
MEYSRIGPWSEAKLRILKEYANPYSTILKNQYGFRHAYIDAFAGAGWHVSRRTDEFVPGSPLNALLVEPPSMTTTSSTSIPAKWPPCESWQTSAPTCTSRRGSVIE